MKNILYLVVFTAVLAGCTTQAQNKAKQATPKEVEAQAATAIEFQTAYLLPDHWPLRKKRS